LLIPAVTLTVTDRAACRGSTYYDPHTKQCYPCSECDPPRTPNAFCLAQCKGL